MVRTITTCTRYRPREDWRGLRQNVQQDANRQGAFRRRLIKLALLDGGLMSLQVAVTIMYKDKSKQQDTNKSLNTNVRNQKSLTSIVVTMMTIYTNQLRGTLYLAQWVSAQQGTEHLTTKHFLLSDLKDAQYVSVFAKTKRPLTGCKGFGSLHPWPSAQHRTYCLSALFLLRGIRQAAPAQVTVCRVVTRT